MTTLTQIAQKKKQHAYAAFIDAALQLAEHRISLTHSQRAG